MKAFLAILLTVTALVLNAEAQVYKFKGPDGVVHYSTTPPNKDAKPADLPPIMKFEMKSLPTPVGACVTHGGDNCEAGPDKDGSVICYDGFTESALPFRFACNSAKLQVADITQPDELGEFSLFLRNAKGVAAKNVKVSYKKGQREVALTGPDSVEASGTAEYRYTPDSTSTTLEGKVEAQNIVIRCENCP